MKITKQNVFLSLAYFPYLGGIIALIASAKHKYLRATGIQSIFVSSFFVLFRLIALFFNNVLGLPEWGKAINLFTEISAPIGILVFMIAALVGKEIRLPFFKKRFENYAI